jgi:hypothetical protein
LKSTIPVEQKENFMSTADILRQEVRQEASYQKTIDLFAREGNTAPQQISLVPEERLPLDTPKATSASLENYGTGLG